MKWYNFETMFKSLRDELKNFLIDNEIEYEISGGPGFYHFEIYTNKTGASMIDSFIEKNTICNMGV